MYNACLHLGPFHILMYLHSGICIGLHNSVGDLQHCWGNVIQMACFKFAEIVLRHGPSGQTTVSY